MRAAATLVFALTACAGVDVANPLEPESRGTCTIEPSVEDGPLTGPYVITMNAAAGGGAEAYVDWNGSGWSGTVEIRMTAPRGPLEAMPAGAQALNDRLMSQRFDEAGDWVIEFEDANCFRRLEFDVRPPGG